MKKIFTRLLACLLMAAMLLPTAALADGMFSVPSFGDIFTPANGVSTNPSSIPTYQWTHHTGAVSFKVPYNWTEVDVGELFPLFYVDDNSYMDIQASDAGGIDYMANYAAIKNSFTQEYTKQGATVNYIEMRTYGGRQAIVVDFTYNGRHTTKVIVQSADLTTVLSINFVNNAATYIDVVMNSLWIGG